MGLGSENGDRITRRLSRGVNLRISFWKDTIIFRSRSTFTFIVNVFIYLFIYLKIIHQ